MSAQSLIIAVLLAFTLMDDMAAMPVDDVAAKPVDADSEEDLKAIIEVTETLTPLMAIDALG